MLSHETPTEVRSRIMRAARSKDTMPELKVRRTVHAMGFRYRLHCKELPGTPDLVFKAKKKAVFVHGCFWHGHDCLRGDRLPKANRDYWKRKLGRNKLRDRERHCAHGDRMGTFRGVGVRTEGLGCIGASASMLPE